MRRGRRLACLAAVLALLAAAGGALAQTRAEEDESALLVAEGRRALARGDYARAAAVLDRALAVNPRRVEAYILRAGVHAARREYDRGIALMRRARTIAPDSPEVLGALGTQLMLGGRVDEGVPLLEEVAAASPDQFQAHALLGHHYVEHGRFREGIAALDRYLATRPASLAGEDAVHLLALADAHLRVGDADRARGLFETVLRAAPHNRRAQLGLAWATAATDCRRALPLLDRVADLAARHPEVLIVRGRCLLALGRATEARELADRYLAARPRAAEGHALRGEAMAAAGALAGAREALGTAVELAPGRPHYLVRLARVERLSGLHAAALARLLAHRPAAPDPEWSLELAEAHLAAGQAVEAAAAAGELCAARPEDPGPRVVLGAARLAAGDTAAAIPELERARDLDRGSARARRLLERAYGVTAVSALRAGDAAAAEEVLGRAEALPPEDPATWRNLGIVRLKAGRPAEALAAFDRALAGGPDAAVLQLRGRALALLGHHEEARAALEKALALAPPDRAADVMLELAATEAEAGKPERALARLEPAAGGADAARVVDAYVALARAAAAARMHGGDYHGAFVLLERAERRVPAARRDLAVAVRCEAALAATAAGEERAARVRLRELGRASQRCPFRAPADELAVPVLTSINEASGSARAAERALARLTALRRRHGAAAAALLDDAIRWMTVQAAIDAWRRGQPARARTLLAGLRAQAGRPDPVVVLGLAVLDLEEGKVDQALTVLERVAAEQPEALVHLGIAWDRKGDPLKALEYYRRAAADGRLRFAPLEAWIAAKRRVLGAAAKGGVP